MGFSKAHNNIKIEKMVEALMKYKIQLKIIVTIVELYKGDQTTIYGGD